MQYMHWSWHDYCELPWSYKAALIEMINEEHRERRRATRIAEMKARRVG